MPERRRRILVVDDDTLSRFTFARLLEGMGHDVDTAPSGEAALAMVSRSNYSVVFMDIRMPGMDGAETAERMIEAGFRGMIVAATGECCSHVSALDEAGVFRTYVQKPFTFESVSETISRIFIR